MKAANPLLLSALLLVMIFGSSKASENKDSKVYEIYTNAVTCDFCVYDLEQIFLKMKGVTEFDVDIDGILFIKAGLDFKLEETTAKKLLIKNGFDYKGMKEKIK